MRRRQQSVALVLFLVSIIFVCKDDKFAVLTATKFINESIEKCTMYRAAMRNGTEFFQQLTENAVKALSRLLVWLL